MWYFSPRFVVYLVCCSAGFFCSTDLRGQAPLLPFRHIGYEQGLSNSTIESIFQDSKGFMWIGTRDGLDRYDGNDMTVYRNDLSDSNSLSDNYIRCIAEDRDHNIWVGTSDGLNCFNPKTKVFTRYLHDPGNARTLAGNAISTLLADNAGRLWVGTDGNGLDLLGAMGSGARNPFVHLPTMTGGLRGVWGEHINSLCMGAGGGLWIATDKGLNYFDSAVRHFSFYTDSSAGGPSLSIMVIRADSSGNLWLGTAENGIRVYHPGTGVFTTYLHEDKQLSSLAGNMVKSILHDRTGRTWIGCINGGLNLFNPLNGTFFHYQNDPQDPSSLSQRTVSALVEDNQGNLWIGTHRGGIDLYMPGAVKFRKYLIPGGEGLANNDVRAFYEDSLHRIWIGTDGGGLNVWDRSTHHFKAFRYDPFNAQSLGADAILHIMEDHAGRMWIASWEGGLNLYHPTTGNFTRYLHDPSKNGTISSNYIQKTFEDRKGRLWVATYFGGLNLLDPMTAKFQRITEDPSGATHLTGNNIVSMDEDRQGNIWLGTDDGGLNRMDLTSGRFSHYFNHEGKSPDLRVIFTDHKGRLWIGQWGLFLYNPSLDTFISYTDTGGLSHTFIKGITEDAQGNFWISTGGGLVRFNPDTYSYTRFNTGDGLQGLEFEAGAYLQTRSGQMLFGGTNGFNAFYPGDIHRNPYVPPVYITGLQIFDKKWPLHDTISLTYKQTDVSFTFTALNYTVPENNQYAYRLENFEKDWHYVGNEHKANYTNLDPGTYVFRVRAANNDGVWNDLGTAVRIVISPPFWRTGWFLALVSVFLIGSGYAFFRFKRNLELARLEEKKRQEIQQVQLQFFTNMSHELRTPLTLILGQVEKLFKADVSVSFRPFYQSIYRNAGRLMSLINELMDFRKLETGALPLHVMPGNLSLFLREVAEDFDNWAAERSITFTLRTEEDPSGPPTWFDRQVLEKIVLNLLHNAFKYTDPGGAVTIELLSGLSAFTPSFDNELLLKNDIRSGRYVYIRVADTGIGISKESIQHLFERYYRISESHLGSGVGLAFVRSLTQLHKGDIMVYSERLKGTEFIIALPSEEVSYTPTEKWTTVGNAGHPQLESIRIRDESVYVPDGLAKDIAEGTDSSETPLILIVEDNLELRQFLVDSFQPYYKVAEAKDGRQGWEMVKESFPDLIISDVMMPGMNGVELCRLVKQDAATSHVPFVMLTAKDAREAKLEGVESGADYYFTKPVSMDLLLVTIQNIFSRQQKLKDHYARDYQVQARELVHSSKDKAFMDALMETIHAQLINPDLDVDYLCGQLGMSRTKLYQKIKQISGQSIGEFVRTIRLRKAVDILLHEDVAFTEVMYRIGIQSQSYFTKAFKKEFGKTPTQFLQEIKR